MRYSECPPPDSKTFLTSSTMSLTIFAPPSALIQHLIKGECCKARAAVTKTLNFMGCPKKNYGFLKSENVFFFCLHLHALPWPSPP